MRKLLIIWILLIGFAQAQSKAGFYVVGGKVITVQDDNSKAYLKAIENAGVVPSVLQNAASNFLVTSEKAIGSYSLITAQYPFIGGTAATHIFNLNNPNGLTSGFTLQFFGGWIHNSLGAKPNGVNAYADTFFIPSANLTLGNGHLSYYATDNVVNNAIDNDMGSGNNNSDYFRLIVRRSDNSSFSLFTNTTTIDFRQYLVTKSQGYSLGNILSNNISMFKDDVKLNSVNSFNSGGSTLPTQAVVIGAYRESGVGDFSNKRTGYNSMGAGLTDTQAIQQSRIVTFFNSMQSR